VLGALAPLDPFDEEPELLDEEPSDEEPLDEPESEFFDELLAPLSDFAASLAVDAPLRLSVR
jgi:hypothetical protein